MSVEEKLDELLTIVKAIAAPAAPAPVDTSNLATSVQVEALSAQVAALATVVGTETPASTPAPESSADSPPAA